MKILNFDAAKLVKYLLDQKWHSECEIIPNYMPPRPSKDTKPKVVVMFPNQYENVFLRYSCGPAQGFFWDTYGDDMQSVELAILALSKAPVPLNFRKLESHVKFNTQVNHIDDKQQRYAKIADSICKYYSTNSHLHKNDVGFLAYIEQQLRQ